MIDGSIYTAEDEGSGVNGRHIDIYCDTHAEAAAYGLQRREVYPVPQPSERYRAALVSFPTLPGICEARQAAPLRPRVPVHRPA